jgi:hypothetical protein
MFSREQRLLDGSGGSTEGPSAVAAISASFAISQSILVAFGLRYSEALANLGVGPGREAKGLTLAVALFGLFVAALGIAGLFDPARLLALVTRVQSQLGLNLIAAFRILIGIALILAAPASRAPLYLQVLGALSLLSGIVTPFVGVRRFEAILAWWQQRSPGAIRLWSGLVAVFGLSLLWAVVLLERAT